SDVHPGVPDGEVVELEVVPSEEPLRSPTNTDRLTVLRGLLEVDLTGRGHLVDRVGHPIDELVDQAVSVSIADAIRLVDLIPEIIEVGPISRNDDVSPLVEASLSTDDHTAMSGNLVQQPAGNRNLGTHDIGM